MTDRQSPQDMIETYRKQKQQALIILIAAIVVLIIGAAFIIFSLVGNDGQGFSFLSSPTPTATNTPEPTATNTPTLTPQPSPTLTLEPPTATATPAPTDTPSGPSIYIVQENDTLYTIAQKFGLDVLTLLAVNPQIDPATLIIRVGDQIIIPVPGTTLPTATPLPTDIRPGTLIDYIVQPNDTLADIALRFNSTVEEILKRNPTIKNANDIQVGQIIKVPVNIATPIPTATQGTLLPTINAPTNTPAVTATTQP
jgi:LysM repeat protein